MQSNRTKIALATVVAVLVFAFILTVTRGDRPRDLVLSIEPIDPGDEVTVYVGGAVSEPGLFSLPRGSRVADAVDLAGPRETADMSGLQLARVLLDEQTITVPEQAAEQTSEPPEPASVDVARSTDLLDINQATETELQTLPGIGPALAERIRERRNLDGPFQSLDELSEVSGISDRMVEELRPYAIVEP